MKLPHTTSSPTKYSFLLLAFFANGSTIASAQNDQLSLPVFDARVDVFRLLPGSQSGSAVFKVDDATEVTVDILSGVSLASTSVATPAGVRGFPGVLLYLKTRHDYS